MTKEIKYVRDLHGFDITNPPIDIRVFDSVWVEVDELYDSGVVGVYHLSGYPQENREEFEDILGIADGSFCLEPDETIYEVRYNTE